MYQNKEPVFFSIIYQQKDFFWRQKETVACNI